MTGTIAAFLVFTFIHFIFFRPAAARYRAALANVGGIEAVFNPSGAQPLLPPRLFALITEHSLTPQDAADRGGSGALGVVFLEDLGRIAARSGLTVVTSEPGIVAQQPLSVQIRVHVRLRGRYSDFVSFFDELAKSGTLTMVDALKIMPTGDRDDLELSVSRLYLKRVDSKR